MPWCGGTSCRCVPSDGGLTPFPSPVPMPVLVCLFVPLLALVAPDHQSKATYSCNVDEFGAACARIGGGHGHPPARLQRKYTQRREHAGFPVTCRLRRDHRFPHRGRPGTDGRLREVAPLVLHYVSPLVAAAPVRGARTRRRPHLSSRVAVAVAVAPPQQPRVGRLGAARRASLRRALHTPQVVGCWQRAASAVVGFLAQAFVGCSKRSRPGRHAGNDPARVDKARHAREHHGPPRVCKPRSFVRAEPRLLLPCTGRACAAVDGRHPHARGRRGGRRRHGRGRRRLHGRMRVLRMPAVPDGMPASALRPRGLRAVCG